MTICYDKLWNLMRANKMKKCDLARAAKISDYNMSKLYNDLPVNLEIIMNICKVFHCNIGDVMDLIEQDNVAEEN